MLVISPVTSLWMRESAHTTEVLFGRGWVETPGDGEPDEDEVLVVKRGAGSECSRW
jgi:hypothetical protein